MKHEIPEPAEAHSEIRGRDGPPASGTAGAAGPDGNGRQAPGLPCEEARAIAERAHHGQVEPSGAPYLDHVRRVVASVPAEASSVAWLHDVFEWTELAEEDLALAGLAPHERRALRLLTRRHGSDDDDDEFVAHVWRIAVAPGAAGDIARAVKRADMLDRLGRPRDPHATWRPPYSRALDVLEAAWASPRSCTPRAASSSGSDPGWEPGEELS